MVSIGFRPSREFHHSPTASLAVLRACAWEGGLTSVGWEILPKPPSRVTGVEWICQNFSMSRPPALSQALRARGGSGYGEICRATSSDPPDLGSVEEREMHCSCMTRRIVFLVFHSTHETKRVGTHFYGCVLVKDRESASLIP